MQQTINLVKSLPGKPKVTCSATQLLLGLLGLMIVWVILYGLAAWYQSSASAELQQLRQQNDKFMETIQTHANSAFQNKKEQLEDEIDKAQDKLKRQKQLAGVVKKESAFENKGFTSFLKLIATTMPSSAWLTGIDLTQGGQQIRLQGKTLKSKAMPHYIAKLNQQSVLQSINLTLSLANVQRQKQEGNQTVYQFLVKSGSKQG